MMDTTVRTKPIVKESLDRKAASYLRNAVMSGQLSPGERLTEQTLSADLGLSRGTIRAALQRLAAEGLVTQKIYSNWEVMALSSKDAQDLFMLRAGLEGLAGEHVSAHITEAQKKTLGGAYDALLEASASGEPNRLAEADFKLHRTIVHMAGNVRLVAHYAMVEMQLRVYIRSVNVLMETAQLVATSHTGIVDAIRDGDSKEARRQLEEHCLFYGDRLVKKLEAEGK